MFVNPQIALDSLPDAEEVAWHRLHPRFVVCRQAQRLVAVLLLAVPAGVAVVLAAREGLEVEAWGVALAACGVALCAIAFLAWPMIDVPRRGYAVRDKDIVYRHGVVWRSVKVVPFNRVQHATTGSGPVERKFGLAKLTVFTAGGSGGDLRIAGLGQELAERLRAAIVGKLGGEEPTATE